MSKRLIKLESIRHQNRNFLKNEKRRENKDKKYPNMNPIISCLTFAAGIGCSIVFFEKTREKLKYDDLRRVHYENEIISQMRKIKSLKDSTRRFEENPDFFPIPENDSTKVEIRKEEEKLSTMINNFMKSKKI